jgi:NADH-quinone oxidoreductase subunit N
MGVLMVDVFQKGSRSEPSRPLIPWLSLAGLGATALVNLWSLRFTAPLQPGLIAVDGFRVFVNFVFLIGAALTILVSMGYLDRRGINRGEFHVLVLFSTVGMMIMASSLDLIMFFLALELMSIGIYVLAGFDRADPRSSEASLKYFLLGAFSSAFLLYGIALLFGSTGTTNVAVIAPTLGAGVAESGMFLVGSAVLLIGLMFKVGAIPFHVWTPDAYDGAPTPVTVLMATGVKAAAFAAFIRIFAVAFSGAYQDWSAVLWWVAVLTMFGANLIALTQGSIKRMLAYSSIAHAGYLLVAVLAANALGAAAFLFYLLVYTLMTGGAFGVLIANCKDGRERVALQDYAGFGWQQPLLGAVFAIFLLSLAGFPLTGGFVGKLFILRAILSAQQPLLAVFLVLASLISYFYYLRVVIVMYMRPAPSEDAHRGLAVTAPTKFAVVAAAVSVIVLFFAPGWFLDAAQSSVAGLFGPAGTFFGMQP